MPARVTVASQVCTTNTFNKRNDSTEGRKTQNFDIAARKRDTITGDTRGVGSMTVQQGEKVDETMGRDEVKKATFSRVKTARERDRKQY